MNHLKCGLKSAPSELVERTQKWYVWVWLLCRRPNAHFANCGEEDRVDWKTEKYSTLPKAVQQSVTSVLVVGQGSGVTLPINLKICLCKICKHFWWWRWKYLNRKPLVAGVFGHRRPEKVIFLINKVLLVEVLKLIEKQKVPLTLSSWCIQF